MKAGSGHRLILNHVYIWPIGVDFQGDPCWVYLVYSGQILANGLFLINYLVRRIHI